MEFPSVDPIYLMGAGLSIVIILGLILSIIGTSIVYIFWRTRKIIIPRISLLLLTTLEIPIKRLASLKGIEFEFVDNMIAKLRNNIYHEAYAQTPYDQRAIFIPQCLRNPKCPAKLNAEGLQCVNCGLCGLGGIKQEAENLGYKFFIAPGSSLIKRMIKKYRPKAVLGVGCALEVKEGTGLIEAIGIPVQSVSLKKDGCVDTRIDVSEALKKILTNDELLATPAYQKKIADINSRWSDEERASMVQIKQAQEMYLNNTGELR